MMSDWEVVIGLEIHAQLATKSKIFSGSATAYGAPPNTQANLVDLAYPGVLPVLNEEAVRMAVKFGLAIGATVARRSVFARKNYFYPDLPKGYQISQYELPLAEHGSLEIQVNGQRKKIGITRIHLEEDAGRRVHSESRPVSFVDFNRTGVPLIEIVSEPDLRTPDEAVEYLKGLRNILLYLEICDGNMEEGSLRCDANISLRPVGQTEFGTKTELKNMNSFRFVRQALEYEIRRQRALLSEGREIAQETRLWDAHQGQTFSMRGKEEAHDYRYFPDPDLMPVRIDPAWLEELRGSLPELPTARAERFQQELGLPAYDAEVLTSDKTLADYFEACLKEFPQAKQVSNWIMAEVMRELKKEEAGITSLKVSPRDLGRLLALVDRGAISGKMAKTVFEEMIASGREPEAIIQEKGLAQISDAGALEDRAREILAAHPREVADYQAGKTKVLGFFVGQL